ncbi:hypothetical protein MTO96_012050 [Rhipicephalus appendiculatus]
MPSRDNERVAPGAAARAPERGEVEAEKKDRWRAKEKGSAAAAAESDGHVGARRARSAAAAHGEAELFSQLRRVQKRCSRRAVASPVVHDDPQSVDGARKASQAKGSGSPR